MRCRGARLPARVRGWPGRAGRAARLPRPSSGRVEDGQVIETGSGVGVLGSQHAFADGQGALEERLGFLVLPLVGVEECQVIETAGGFGVLGSQHAFVDGQGALVRAARLSRTSPVWRRGWPGY